MLSVFSRYTKPMAIPYYNSNISKYITDTTNQIKESYTNTNTTTNEKTNDIIIRYHYKYYKCDCDFSIVHIFSMISCLAGYYLSKYNN